MLFVLNGHASCFMNVIDKSLSVKAALLPMPLENTDIFEKAYGIEKVYEYNIAII